MQARLKLGKFHTEWVDVPVTEGNPGASASVQAELIQIEVRVPPEPTWPTGEFLRAFWGGDCPPDEEVASAREALLNDPIIRAAIEWCNGSPGHFGSKSHIASERLASAIRKAGL